MSLSGRLPCLRRSATAKSCTPEMGEDATGLASTVMSSEQEIQHADTRLIDL
jgi:hypothetical protein